MPKDEDYLRMARESLERAKSTAPPSEQHSMPATHVAVGANGDGSPSQTNAYTAAIRSANRQALLAAFKLASLVLALVLAVVVVISIASHNSGPSRPIPSRSSEPKSKLITYRYLEVIGPTSADTQEVDEAVREGWRVKSTSQSLSSSGKWVSVTVVLERD